jgi:hypothetical protein
LRNILPAKLLCLLAAAVFPAEIAARDSTAAALPEREHVLRFDTRIAGENPADMRYLPVTRVSTAEVFFTKTDGDFANYYRSNNAFELGAFTESFLRLNPKAVLYGMVRYSNATGKNSGGSVFIDPNAQAFDIVEMVDSLRGTKNMEDYRLAGAASVRLTERLTLGGRIGYRAANYAKFKDLRHVNKLFELTLSIGATYSFGSKFEAGANWFYRRSVEGLSFKLYGTSDRQYVSLISFGAFYGKAELFGGNGYTDPNNGSPAVDSRHGGSLQASAKPSRNAMLFGRVYYRKRSGYFGKRSPSTPVFLEYSAPVYGGAGAFAFSRGANRHGLELSVESERLKAFENVYREESVPGGKSDIVYLGSNKVSDRSVVEARLAATSDLKLEGLRPKWSLRAESGYWRRRQTVSMYPFFRRQDVWRADIRLLAERSIVRGDNIYGIALGLLYGTGGGSPKTDGTYSAPSESLHPPREYEAGLLREFAYLTAERIGSSVGLIWKRRLAGGVHAFLKLNCDFTRALNTAFRNSSLSCFSIAAGVM